MHKANVKWCPGRFCLIFVQFGSPFWIDFVTFLVSVDIVKTVLPLARESYFRGFDVCKTSIFYKRAFGISFGEHFSSFFVILGSIWVPGWSILAPPGVSFGSAFFRCVLDAKMVHFGGSRQGL